MPTIGSILATARTAMIAQQAGVQVTSHNIANASVEGYSRQRAQFATNAPNIQPNAVFGTGVYVHDVSRMRETFLDTAFRDASTDASGYRRRFEMMSQVEGLFMEPSDAGLGASLDAFYSSWADLANNPMNDTARSVVRESAVSVIAHFRRLNVGLEQIRSSGMSRVAQEVAELNHMTSQVAQLNTRILATESGGNEASDLRDARDRALDRIAELVPAQVMHRADGSVAVGVNGALLVDGSEAVALRLDTTGAMPTLRTSRNVEIPVTTGSLGGALQVLRHDIPTARRTLDDIAAQFVASVNGVHAAGMGPAGQSVNFFNPDGLSAGTIQLSAEVQSNIRHIAAGTPGTDADGNPVYRAGATDIAWQLSELRTVGPTHASYTTLVTDVGMSVRSSADARTVQETLAFQAGLRRTSVSGVSIDEEMVNLIRYQNAYAAAARVISTADEMLQTVLGMVR